MPKPSPVLKLIADLKFADDKLKYPNTPESYIPRGKYSEKNTNELTKSVLAFIKYTGGQAERINKLPRPLDNRTVVTDVLGGRRTIGSIEFLPSGGTGGTADISATVGGLSVKIEVKFGKDKQSKDQVAYEASVKRAGGIYLIAKTIDQFYEDYCRVLAPAAPAANSSELLQYWQRKIVAFSLL